MATRTSSLLLTAALVLSSATAFADPPPWAPAHGWRAKHGQTQQRVIVVERPVFYSWPVGIPGGSCDRDLIDRELVGAVVGGGLGGLAGSQIGSGSGRTYAVIGGVIVGTIVGAAIGRSMDVGDQACAAQAMELADPGRTVAWRNPDTGRTYELTPTQTVDRGGVVCREYSARAVIDGRPDTVTGIACRMPDGSWQLAG